jgi:hypothetical protein
MTDARRRNALVPSNRYPCRPRCSIEGGGEKLGIKSKLDVLAVTLVATVMMVILGLIYFFLTLLIVKVATDVLFDDPLSASMGALSAALVTASVIIAGALEKKRD